MSRPDRPRALASAWYVGRVGHTRHAPVPHRFDYSMMMGLFDLDELDLLDRSVRGFGVNRRSAVGFRTADHGPADGSPLRPWAADRLADAGLDPAGADGPIRLLCMPRTLGYGFDPITVWFLHDEGGRPSALIHEVRNTFGHRHSYVAPVDDPGRPLWRQRVEKTMHVSPFFDRDGWYDFTVRPPTADAGSTTSVRIDYSNGDGPQLTASFVGERRPFTTAGMLGAAAHSPAVAQKAIVGIHFEALKLWRKRLRYRSVPRPPDRPVTAGSGSGTPGCPVSTDRPSTLHQNRIPEGLPR